MSVRLSSTLLRSEFRPNNTFHASIRSLSSNASKPSSDLKAAILAAVSVSTAIIVYTQTGGSSPSPTEPAEIQKPEVLKVLLSTASVEEGKPADPQTSPAKSDKLSQPPSATPKSPESAESHESPEANAPTVHQPSSAENPPSSASQPPPQEGGGQQEVSKPVEQSESSPKTLEEESPSESSAFESQTATSGHSYQVPYVIVGAGTAAHFAMKAILERDPSAKILIIGEEMLRPYTRTPLSKEAWTKSPTVSEDEFLFQAWNGEMRSLFHEKPSFYASLEAITSDGQSGAALLLGRRVIEVDTILKRLILDNGDAVFYDKCLLATGGHPQNLPLFEEAPTAIKSNVILYRNLDDFQALQTAAASSKSIVVVGGGFWASELAVALAHSGRHTGLAVHQVFPEKGHIANVLPEYLSEWASKQMKLLGVTVHSSSQVKQVAEHESGMVLTLDSGAQVVADKVVVATGLQPNTALAESGRLETDPVHLGFLVNSELQARSGVWAAGDACSFYDISLGRRREEYYDNAAVTGHLAGSNMAGAGKPFFNQSTFWCDLGPNMGFEAVGVLDSALPTVAVWAKPSSTTTDTEYSKGVIFYLRNKQVVGMLLWNIFDGIPIAKKIIRSEKAFENVADLARYFSLYDD